MRKSLTKLNVDWLSLLDPGLSEQHVYGDLFAQIRIDSDIDVTEAVLFDESGKCRSFDEFGAEVKPLFPCERYPIDDASKTFVIDAADGLNWLRVRIPGGVLIFGSGSRFGEVESIDAFVHSMSLFFIRRAEITHRASAERNAHLYKILLQKIIDFIPEYVAFKDTDNVYRIANKRAESMFSIPAGTIVGLSVDQVYPPDEAEVVHRMDRDTLASPIAIRTDFQPLTHQGRVTLETIRERVMNEEGEPIGIITISRDIEGERKTTIQLDRRIRLQKILMKIATDFINTPEDEADMIIDDALKIVGEFIQADRAYMFTYDFEHGLMHNLNEWCASGIAPAINDLANVPIEDFRDDWVNPHLNGLTIYVEDIDKLDRQSNLFNILNPQGIRSLVTIPLHFKDDTLGFVGFDAVRSIRNWGEDDLRLLKVLGELFTNFMIRRRRYEEMLKAQELALSANQTKSSFLAKMSHEIRTPLVSVFNAIYLIAKTSLSREQKGYLDIINTSLDLLYTLVNSILDLSKIEAGKVEIESKPVDLEVELYKIAKAQSYVAFDKGLRFIFDFDYSVPRIVVTDAVRLHQIIVNLINNAIKYTDRGQIELKTTFIASTPDTVTVEFAVTDTGIGIPADKLKYITEKYYQVSTGDERHLQGTGLGLTIADELVRLLGGHLRITSRVGEGSSMFFQLKLPVQKDAPRPVSRLRGKRIVLGGGDAQLRRTIASLLVSIDSILTIATAPVEGDYDYYLFIGATADGTDVKMYDLDRGSFNRAFDDSALLDKMADATAIPLPTTADLVCDSLFAGNPIPDGSAGSNTVSLCKGIRLLVVDDNPMNRHTLAAILSRSGYTTDIAHNGREAIDMVQAKKYSLLLVDIQMPEMNGYQLTERIRAILPSKPHLPIIALSANAMKSDLELAATAGMDNYIIKPIKPEQLLALIKEYLPMAESEETTDSVVIIIPEVYPPFDEIGFRERFDHDRILADEMLNAFFEEYVRDIDAIEQAIVAQDAAGIVSSAHFFKGSCLYVGASRLVWLCQLVMREAGEHNIDYLKGVTTMMHIEAKSFENTVHHLYFKEESSL